MFTGIVQGLATVTAVQTQENALRLELDLGDLVRDIQHGASVSVAGVCLTVVAVDGTRVQFDVMGETLTKTALGSLHVNDRVNIERSARLGDEIGGHPVSGHVSTTGMIKSIDTSNSQHVVTIATEASWMPYMLPKGFVALDGCSLTIVDVGADWFTVHLIPETLTRTTFGTKKTNGAVHIEIDPMTRAVVDTVVRMMDITKNDECCTMNRDV